MLKDTKYRWFIIIFVIVASAYLTWPTYKYYSLSEVEKEQVDPIELKTLKTDAINNVLDVGCFGWELLTRLRFS